MTRIKPLRTLVAIVALGGIASGARADDGLASYSFTKGWATFGLALPQGAAKDAFQIGRLPTQTDVKVRWPDGSVRFAVLSANVPTAGVHRIAAAPAAPGTMTSTSPPQVAVTLTIGGRPYAANLPAARADFWLNGPLVSESRAIVAPGDHPFLRVIFDLRLYSGGGSRVDVTLENCLDVSTADEVAYDVAIAVGGRKVFEQPNVRHKYLARWRKVFATDGLQESVVTPDLAPFVAARAVPPYLSTIASPERSVKGAGASGTGFGILGFGDLTVPMDAHSGRPELAPYPDWTAQFLVHKTVNQRAHVIRHGELAGSWGIHIKEPDGVTMISIDRHPYYWLDPRWVDNKFEGPKNKLRGRAEPGDIAHQPSLAFVPYLVTGDRFFADELAYWANFCLIGSFASDDNRKGPQGLLIGNEVRGIGWGLRNLGDAAAYLPDSSPMKAYLASKVWNNLTYLDKYAGTFESGPVQTLFPRRRPEDGIRQYQPYMWISLWEQSYLAWAVDHVMRHGQVTGSYDVAKAGATIRNRIARLQLSLFTNPQWPKDHEHQAPYLLAAAKWANGPGSTLSYFQKFSEVATATFSVPAPSQPDFVRPFEGYYGPEARLLLMICEELGDAGASSSLAGLMADVNNGARMVDDLNKRSGWAIARDAASQTVGNRTTAAPQRAAARRGAL